ncbi:MAG TPA: YncE family protein [Candidatus Angelobacter sp.]|nr:YncE family protein [Candidatus Angelobacter sp.]
MKSCQRLLLVTTFSILVFAGQCFAESIVASITTEFPEALDVNPLTRLIYSASFDDKLFVIDQETNSVVDSMQIPASPQGTAVLAGVAVNPVTSRLYVSDIRGNLVYVIDSRSKQILASIPLTGPNDIRVNIRTNKIYVNQFFANQLAIIDGNTSAVTNTISISSPQRVTVDIFTNRIYVPLQNFFGSVWVLDGTNDTVLAQISTGLFTTAVAVDFLRHVAYASNQFDATLSVIDTNTNTVTGTIPTGQGPAPVEVDPFTNHISVAALFDNVIDVIDGNTQKIVQTLPVPPQAFGSAIDLIHQRIYFNSSNSNTITVVSTRP